VQTVFVSQNLKVRPDRLPSDPITCSAPSPISKPLPNPARSAGAVHSNERLLKQQLPVPVAGPGTCPPRTAAALRVRRLGDAHLARGGALGDVVEHHLRFPPGLDYVLTSGMVIPASAILVATHSSRFLAWLGKPDQVTEGRDPVFVVRRHGRIERVD
jgi:hypothetical protein